MEDKKKEIPYNFWNYKINPIVGYYIKREDNNFNKQTKKYGIKEIPYKTNDC